MMLSYWGHRVRTLVIVGLSFQGFNVTVHSEGVVMGVTFSGVCFAFLILQVVNF